LSCYNIKRVNQDKIDKRRKYLSYSIFWPFVFFSFAFSQICVHIYLFYLFVLTACHCYFLAFTRFYRLRSLVISDEISAERLLWSTSFGSEGTFFIFILFLYYLLFCPFYFILFYIFVFLLFIIVIIYFY